MTAKTIRVFIAKDKTGQVTAIGVPAANLANKIGLHHPEGGTTEAIEVAVQSKSQTAPLERETVEELLASGRLKKNAQRSGSKRR